MEEKEILNIQNLFYGLDIANNQNNLVQIEFCSALLSKYLQEGVKIYDYASFEKYNDMINKGMNLFVKRKRKFFIKKLILNFFTALAVALFTFLYLKLNIYRSLIFFVIAFILDSLFKKNVNKIVFCVETKREYIKYVSNDLLQIRKSEDESKLWK